MIKAFYPLLSKNNAKAIINDLGNVIPSSPFIQQSSYSMTNLGQVGWVSDEKGERFQDVHPLTNQPWGKIPDSILKVVRILKSLDHIPQDFTPNNCQIYKFEQGDSFQLSVLDQSQKNLDSPTIMITLGGKATHQIEALTQSDDIPELELYNGDVLTFSEMAKFQKFGVKPITGKKQAVLWLRQVG